MSEQLLREYIAESLQATDESPLGDMIKTGKRAYNTGKGIGRSILRGKISDIAEKLGDLKDLAFSKSKSRDKIRALAYQIDDTKELEAHLDANDKTRKGIKHVEHVKKVKEFATELQEKLDNDELDHDILPEAEKLGFEGTDALKVALRNVENKELYNAIAKKLKNIQKLNDQDIKYIHGVIEEEL